LLELEKLYNHIFSKMKKRNLFPLVLFCIIFLAYSLYFVKVINTTEQLEPNSIAKTIKRALENRNTGEVVPDKAEVPEILSEPVVRYVNYRWLNVRENPVIGSKVVEKIYKDDEVNVLSYPTSGWALIETGDGNTGYVARDYLSDKAPKTAPVVATPDPIVPVVEKAEPTDTLVVTEGDQTIYDLPVITYHHISDETKLYPPSMVLPEINFFAQLDYLVENGFTAGTFRDLDAVRKGSTSIPEKMVIISFNGGYEDAYIAAQHLNGKGFKGVFFITTDKIGTEGYLDWRQVQKMHEWGMEIGSGGVTGASLLSSGEFYVRDEIFRSKQIIDEKLGTPIISFAYANGAFNNSVEDIVEEAGYLFARSSNDGSRYTTEQFFQIPTLRVFFPAGANQFRVWLGQ
jgi:peptidoglycan/xylan/chitin deacetylase (PgdA/CDA1 family)